MSYNKATRTFADALRDVRARRGNISQRALGRMIGIAGTGVTRMEMSQFTDPRDFLEKLWPVLVQEEKLDFLEILAELDKRRFPV